MRCSCAFHPTHWHGVPRIFLTAPLSYAAETYAMSKVSSFRATENSQPVHCVRNSSLEELHAGTFPSSKTGDYTDVKVVSPYGEIAWNQLGRISDEEMKPLMEEIVDRLYTFLVLFLERGEPEHGLPQPKNCSAPQRNAEISGMWDRY